MSKIVIAVNSMISHAEKISDVIVNKEDNEFIFKYDDKYVWGITTEDEDYRLCFYPETREVDELRDFTDWNKFPLVAYYSTDFKTREALESFGELYLIMKEKLHNVDEVLEDIIGDLK